MSLLVSRSQPCPASEYALKRQQWSSQFLDHPLGPLEPRPLWSDAPAETHPGSALHGSLCCGDAEPGATSPHHQQPGTGCAFPTDALVLGRLGLHSPALASGGVLSAFGAECLVDLQGQGWRSERKLAWHLGALVP